MDLRTYHCQTADNVVHGIYLWGETLDLSRALVQTRCALWVGDVAPNDFLLAGTSRPRLRSHLVGATIPLTCLRCLTLGCPPSHRVPL